jgi:hypothetical protein
VEPANPVIPVIWSCARPIWYRTCELPRLSWVCQMTLWMIMANYYELLGIPPNASVADIEAACQMQLARPRTVDPGRVRVLPPAEWAGRLDEDMATRNRHSPEQVARKLARADRMLGQARTSPTCVASSGGRADLRPLTQPGRWAAARRRQTAQGSPAGERDLEAAAGRRRVGAGRAQEARPGTFYARNAGGQPWRTACA